MPKAARVIVNVTKNDFLVAREGATCYLTHKGTGMTVSEDNHATYTKNEQRAFRKMLSKLCLHVLEEVNQKTNMKLNMDVCPMLWTAKIWVE